MFDHRALGSGFFSLASLLFMAGCGDGSSTNGTASSGGGGAASSMSTGGSTSDGGGGSGGGSGGSGGSGSGGGGMLGGAFRHGMNFGYVPGFDDQDMASLARGAGANGARLSFPEHHFAMWGYDIEVADNTAYQAMGIESNVAFLNGPVREHSTAPQSAQDWELDFWEPSNLYEPIFAGDGSVNPDNWWAKYVEQTVSTYKDYVRVYSVWNEPDWVSDYQATLTWGSSPPTAAQLPRFNGSIFEYVRMLRITTEVAKHVDPGVKVAVGGLGYPTFLSAVLRYTDDPSGGEVSAEYPATGASYFDVVDMHYYPIFSQGSSDDGTDGLIALRDDFAAELAAAGAGPRPFVVTESGAPRVAVGGAPGGEAYARNYLLKSMVTAQAQGISGIDWFALSDGDDPNGNSFSSMGCYQNLAVAGSPGAAMRTSTGEAYRTLGALLENAGYDAATTAALALPAGVRGAAFVTAGGKRALVLWARVSGASEDAAASFAFSTEATWNSFAWDAAANGMASTPLSPAGGKLTVELSGTPLFLVEP
jgi:hypothetical protein